MAAPGCGEEGREAGVEGTMPSRGVAGAKTIGAAKAGGRGSSVTEGCHRCRNEGSSRKQASGASRVRSTTSDMLYLQFQATTKSEQLRGRETDKQAGQKKREREGWRTVREGEKEERGSRADKVSGVTGS